MMLSKFVDVYLRRRDVSDQHADLLRAYARDFEKMFGRLPIGEILTVDNANAYLRHEEGKGLAPATVKNKRRALLTLWRAAADDELAAFPNDRKVRKTRCPMGDVSCYTIDEVKALVAAAETVEWDAKCSDEYASGIQRNLFWVAMIQAAWDTGLRRSDLWRLRRDQIKPDGSFVLTMAKTGRRHYGRMRTATLAAIDATFPPSRRLCFPWMPYHHERTFSDHFAHIVKASRVGRGTFRWLRRASGSYVEASMPGAGPRHLGHSNPQTFNMHYDAREISGCNTPLPPDLEHGVAALPLLPQLPTAMPTEPTGQAIEHGNALPPPTANGVTDRIDRYLEDVYLQDQALSVNRREDAKRTIAQLNKHRREAVRFGQLPVVFNKFVRYLESRYSPKTASSKRAVLLSVWKAAASDGLCQAPNYRSLRKVTARRTVDGATTVIRPIEPWGPTAMQAIIEACRSLRGEYYPTGVDRGLFWEAYVRFACETQLRRLDMLQARRDALPTLTGPTIAAIDATFPPDRELVFPWPYRKRKFYRDWSEILSKAGLDCDRRNGPEKLRRTPVALCGEFVEPGADGCDQRDGRGAAV